MHETLASFFDPRLFTFDQQATLAEGVHRPCLVAESTHDVAKRVAVHHAVYGQGGCSEIDGGAAHPWIAPQFHFDEQGAGSAGHSLYCQ